MDTSLALLAALAATGFTVDLVRNYLSRERHHVAAYAAGMAAFAVATWALFFGAATGWTSASYRAFFLFGAIVSVPLLALGSMFLVVGKRAGHIMTFFLFPLFAIAVPMTLAEPFVGPLPAGGVPAGSELFAAGFGPRMWAGVGSGVGATILIVLSVVSLVRFWKSNRRLVMANALILVGTFAASSGGTFLAFGEQGGFAFSLLLAASLIWLGYRVATDTCVPGTNVRAHARSAT